MIRRRKRRISNPFKPHYRSRRQERNAAYRKLRPEVREKTWERDNHQCQWPTCGRYVTLDAAHIHEVEWRSKGGDPTDITNTLTMCGECHLHIHPRVGGALKRIEEPADGDRRFFERKTGKSPWVEVTHERRAS